MLSDDVSNRLWYLAWRGAQNYRFSSVWVRAWGTGLNSVWNRVLCRSWYAE